MIGPKDCLSKCVCLPQVPKKNQIEIGMRGEIGNGTENFRFHGLEAFRRLFLRQNMSSHVQKIDHVLALKILIHEGNLPFRFGNGGRQKGFRPKKRQGLGQQVFQVGAGRDLRLRQNEMILRRRIWFFSRRKTRFPGLAWFILHRSKVARRYLRDGLVDTQIGIGILKRV